MKGLQYKEQFYIDAEWVEAWIEDYSLYVLLLLKRKNGEYIIIDPQEKNKVCAVLPNYEEAETWLLEDEFNIIQTRYMND
jgi:hypothetical protein